PGSENNAYAVVDVSPDLNIAVTGYRRAAGRQLPHSSTVFQTLHIRLHTVRSAASSPRGVGCQLRWRREHDMAADRDVALDAVARLRRTRRRGRHHRRSPAPVIPRGVDSKISR